MAHTNLCESIEHSVEHAMARSLWWHAEWNSDSKSSSDTEAIEILCSDSSSAKRVITETTRFLIFLHTKLRSNEGSI